MDVDEQQLVTDAVVEMLMLWARFKKTKSERGISTVTVGEVEKLFKVFTARLDRSPTLRAAMMDAYANMASGADLMAHRGRAATTPAQMSTTGAQQPASGAPPQRVLSAGYSTEASAPSPVTRAVGSAPNSRVASGALSHTAPASGGGRGGMGSPFQSSPTRGGRGRGAGGLARSAGPGAGAPSGGRFGAASPPLPLQQSQAAPSSAASLIPSPRDVLTPEGETALRSLVRLSRKQATRLKSGFLMQRLNPETAGENTQWRRRFFELTDSCLYWYVQDVSKQDDAAREEPLGFIDLRQLKVRVADKKVANTTQFALELVAPPAGNWFIMSPENEDKTREWEYAIQEACTGGAGAQSARSPRQEPTAAAAATAATAAATSPSLSKKAQPPPQVRQQQVQNVEKYRQQLLQVMAQLRTALGRLRDQVLMRPVTDSDWIVSQARRVNVMKGNVQPLYALLDVEAAPKAEVDASLSKIDKVKMHTRNTIDEMTRLFTEMTLGIDSLDTVDALVQVLQPIYSAKRLLTNPEVLQ